MTNKDAIEQLNHMNVFISYDTENPLVKRMQSALDMAIKAVEQKPIDKSAMMYEIYMEGVNMSGEYQGCWVRFKDIEKIVDKYIKG